MKFLSTKSESKAPPAGRSSSSTKPCGLSRLAAGMALSATLLAPGLVLAQVAAELEGTIVSVVDHGDGTGAMIVMGVPVILQSTTAISSPTAQLSIADLANVAVLPGRSQPGFVGGTAIVVGNSVNGVVTALDVKVEPAENVLIGEVTANSDATGCQNGLNPVDGAILVNGVPVNFLADTRMPFGEAVNEEGFPIDLCSLAQGNDAAVAGYFSAGAMYAFSFESNAAVIAGAFSQTTIARAQCRGNGRLDVRGSTTELSGNVTIHDAVSGVVLGAAAVQQDLLGGVYRLRANVPACPDTIRASHDNGSSASAEVEIR